MTTPFEIGAMLIATALALSLQPVAGLVVAVTRRLTARIGDAG